MVHNLQDENKQLKRDVAQLQIENDHLEQYSRRQSLHVHNDWPEEPREDMDAKVIEMANKYLKIDIKRDQITQSRSEKPQGSPRPIIVKFVTHRNKSRLYNARGSLKMGGTETAKLFISEDLTKKRQSMYAEARQLKKNNFIQDCWTTDGNLFVRDAHARVKIFSDLLRFTAWKDSVWANPPLTYSEVVQHG